MPMMKGTGFTAVRQSADLNDSHSDFNKSDLKRKLGNASSQEDTLFLQKMWKISQSLSGDNEEQGESLLDEESGGLCSLSTTQRIYGFAASFIAGLACMLLSMIVFAKPIKFAVLFTFGNLLAVGSTAFLLGPAQQLRMMLDPVRVFATAIYLGCVVIALICALWIHSKILTIIAIIIEIGALIWYSLSYIPFARRMVSDLMVRLCDTEL